MYDFDLLLNTKGLYKTEFPDGETFFWRLLTLKEYKVFKFLEGAGEIPLLLLYDQVFERCTYGKAYQFNGNLPAGYTNTIGKLIMWLSGDASVNERDELEQARARYPAESVHELMKRIILIAFPSYTPDVFENWTRQELLEKFVIAEGVLVNKGGYQPLDTSQFMTAEEAAKAAKKAKQKQQIDFAKENKQLRGEGFGEKDAGDILDMHPAEAQKLLERKRKTSTAKLSVEMAREMDKKNRRR